MNVSNQFTVIADYMYRPPPFSCDQLKEAFFLNKVL